MWKSGRRVMDYEKLALEVEREILMANMYKRPRILVDVFNEVARDAVEEYKKSRLPWQDLGD